MPNAVHTIFGYIICMWQIHEHAKHLNTNKSAFTILPFHSIVLHRSLIVFPNMVYIYKAPEVLYSGRRSHCKFAVFMLLIWFQYFFQLIIMKFVRIH